MRVDSITSQQADLTGSFSGSFVGSLELTGSVSLADTASYVASGNVHGPLGMNSVLSASYALSASVEIIKEVSSSHADTASYVETSQTASYITVSGIDGTGGTVVGDVTPSNTTAEITITKGSGTSVTKEIFSSSFALKSAAVRRSLSQGLGIETFSYDGSSIQSIQLNTSSAHFTTGAKSAVNSASFSTRVTNLEDFSSSLDNTFATEAELNSATASLSSSLATDIATNTSDISTLNSKTLFSGSAQVSLGGDLSGTANNATVTKVQGVSLTSGEATQLANINSATISNTQWGYLGALDQSLTTTSNITSSNLLVSNNLVVNGTASFALLQSVTGSAKIIGDAYIILNNNTPAERYAGLVVQDSGSAGVTASLEFDGQTNDWFYEYSDDGGVTTDHGVVIFGPEYNTKGSPTYLTEGTIPKSTGSHHIVDSNITDNGSLITLGSNTSITGTVVATGTTLVSGSTQVKSLLPSGTVSGSTQTIANLPAGTVSGSAQTIANLPSGTVSGSAQIDLASATGTAANATSASFATTASFALSVAGGGGGTLTAQTASTSLTMSANVAYVVTGTAAPITMSLPASPSVGDLIKFANMDDRATLLGRNSSNIMGLAEDMTLNVEQVSFDLVYVGPTAGWTIYGSRALS